MSNDNEISVPVESATNIVSFADVRRADRRFLDSSRVEDANSPAPSIIQELERNNRVLVAALDEARAKIASLESQLAGLAKPALSPVQRKEMHDAIWEFFGGDEAKVCAWWDTPNPLLGGTSPTTMVFLEREVKLRDFIMGNLVEGGCVPQVGFGDAR